MDCRKEVLKQDALQLRRLKHSTAAARRQRCSALHMTAVHMAAVHMVIELPTTNWSTFRSLGAPIVLRKSLQCHSNCR
jgi:hypothetical protein